MVGQESLTVQVMKLDTIDLKVVLTKGRAHRYGPCGHDANAGIVRLFEQKRIINQGLSLGPTIKDLFHIIAQNAVLARLAAPNQGNAINNGFVDRRALQNPLDATLAFLLDLANVLNGAGSV